MLIKSKLLLTILTLGFADAITIYPFIFVRETPSYTLLNHERIHERQWVELLWIFFVILYVGEFLIKLILTGFDWFRAYRSVSFEQEADENQGNLFYLIHRVPYSWSEYVFKMWNYKT